MFNPAINKDSIKVIFKNGKAVTEDQKKKSKIQPYTKVILKSHMLFHAVAGKAGVAIYIYLKWQKGMNGDRFFEISNDWLGENYKVTRQTKYAALKKLKKEGLIEVLDRSECGGGNLKVRIRVNEEE